MAELPTYDKLWSRHRDSLNIVMGGVLGAFLGLSISKDGVVGGNYFLLFALLTLNGWAVITILEAYNRYIEGMRWLSALYLIYLIPSVGFVVWASSLIGIDGMIIAIIYASWALMIISKIAALEFAKWIKR